jgi:hypothetical protein
MSTHELVVRPVPSADASVLPRLVALLTTAVDRHLAQRTAAVDSYADVRVYPDVRSKTPGIAR